MVKRWDILLLSFFILAYIAVLGTLSILRHDAFASRFDLSNMDQTLWYTLHGHFFQLRNPDNFTSRFAIHADLILVVLSPIYLIWNNVKALLLTQSILLALGAIPVYFLSLKLLKNKIISLILVIAYLLNPGMQWTNIYEFHGVALAIPFYLSAFYFATVKRWRWYSLFVLLALLTKEEISLDIAMMGLALFFVFKERWIGMTTVVIGVAWFLVMVYLVIPHFSPTGHNWAFDALQNTGEDSVENIIAANIKLDTIKSTFLSHDSITYYQVLLKPTSFMLLLGLPWVLLSIPEIAINVLRHTETITFHYDSGVIPAVNIGAIFGFYYLQSILTHIKKTKRYATLLLYGVAAVFLFIAVRVNYHYSPLPTTSWCPCYIYQVTKEDRDFEKALQSIPKDAFITSSLEIRPHVSHRELAFTVPSATASAEYIALITQNRIISNYNPKDYENQLIPILLSDHHHKLLFKSQHFYLFKKI